MRADVMHGQNVKHRGYTPDIHIRLNNPELSEAVLSDCFKIFFCFGVSSISFICHPGPDIIQECILAPWFRLAAADPFGQQIAQFLKARLSLLKVLQLSIPDPSPLLAAIFAVQICSQKTSKSAKIRRSLAPNVSFRSTEHQTSRREA